MKKTVAILMSIVLLAAAVVIAVLVGQRGDAVSARDALQSQLDAQTAEYADYKQQAEAAQQ